MATKFLNTILNEVLVSLQTEYNVYEVFDVEDANVVLNDVQEADFPIAFFSIKNNATLTLDRYKKTYPSYSIAVWLLNLYEEDSKSQLETNYEGLRLDAMEFTQRFQRVEEFSRVPSNLVISPNVEEFDSSLDLLATALQISFTASVDIQEDTSRVCAPLNVSSFTVNDSDLDAVVLDASASSFRGTASGSTAGTHAWQFTLDTTTINISGLATTSLSASDIALLATIGMDGATGNYNSFTFNKNPDTNPSLAFVITASHTYDFRSKGAVSDATADQIDKRFFFTFQTENTLMDAGFTTSTPAQIDWIFGTDEVVSVSPQYRANYSGAYLDGTRKDVVVSMQDFSLITALTFGDGGRNWIYGDVDLSVFPDDVNYEFLDNNIENIAFRSGQIVKDLVLRENETLLTFNYSNVLFQNSALELPDFFNQNIILSTAYGLNTFTALYIRGLNTGGQDFDLTNAKINTSGVALYPECGAGTILFSTEANTIDSWFGIGAGRLKVTNLDLTNLVCPIFDWRNLTESTGTLTFSNTPNSIIDFNNSGGRFKVFIFQNTIIDSSTTRFNISSHGMSEAEIDAFYIAIHGAWDGIVNLSALVISTTGNVAPSVASLTERDALASAGATINS